MYENPSAGKFEPPPAPRSAAETRAWRRHYVTSILVVAIGLILIFYRPRGWFGLVIAFAGLGSHILQSFNPSPNYKGPYREQTRITR